MGVAKDSSLQCNCERKKGEEEWGSKPWGWWWWWWWRWWESCQDLQVDGSQDRRPWSIRQPCHQDDAPVSCLPTPCPPQDYHCCSPLHAQSSPSSCTHSRLPLTHNTETLPSQQRFLQHLQGTNKPRKFVACMDLLSLSLSSSQISRNTTRPVSSR